MTRGKPLTRSALVLVISLLVPWVGAQERAPESSLTSLTVDLPKDERACEGLAFREISGRFELARPVEGVALTVEAFHDGGRYIDSTWFAHKRVATRPPPAPPS